MANCKDTIQDSVLGLCYRVSIRAVYQTTIEEQVRSELQKRAEQYTGEANSNADRPTSPSRPSPTSPSRPASRSRHTSRSRPTSRSRHTSRSHYTSRSRHTSRGRRTSRSHYRSRSRARHSRGRRSHSRSGHRRDRRHDRRSRSRRSPSARSQRRTPPRETSKDRKAREKKEEADRKKHEAELKKEEREREAARKKHEREKEAARRKSDKQEEQKRKKASELGQRISAKLAGITKALDRDVRDKDISKVPAWCKKQASDTLTELNAVPEKCQASIADRGVTPMTITVEDCEVLDKKAKAAVSMLSTMLKAARHA